MVMLIRQSFMQKNHIYTIYTIDVVWQTKRSKVKILFVWKNIQNLLSANSNDSTMFPFGQRVSSSIKVLFFRICHDCIVNMNVVIFLSNKILLHFYVVNKILEVLSTIPCQ